MIRRVKEGGEWSLIVLGKPALRNACASRSLSAHLVQAMNKSSLLYLSAFILLPSVTGHAGNWPGWRGAEGNGVTSEKNLPMKWTATEGVRWRTELPGPGNSSPIVWGDRVFVSQAVSKEKRRTV